VDAVRGGETVPPDFVTQKRHLVIQ
jgi:hypothetical protein